MNELVLKVGGRNTVDDEIKSACVTKVITYPVIQKGAE